MTVPASEPDARPELLVAALEQTGWSLEQLWIHYVGLGGTAVILDVEAHLADLNALPPGQHDVLVHALNERLADLDHPLRVPYALPPLSDTDGASPLDILDALLADSRGAARANGHRSDCWHRPGCDCTKPGR